MTSTECYQTCELVFSNVEEECEDMFMKKWIDSNGKEYLLDNFTEKVYDKHTHKEVGTIQSIEEKILKKKEKQRMDDYKNNHHILIETWGEPPIDITEDKEFSKKRKDFVMSVMLENIGRIMNISPEKMENITKIIYSHSK